MSVIPHLKPEVIEHMPESMFGNIQEALPLALNEIHNRAEARWQADSGIPSGDHRLLDILEPCLNAIIRAERQRITFIEFSIRNGLVQPGETQGSTTPHWHHDGSAFDKTTKYITANAFTTEFLGNWLSIYRPQPGELVRFDSKKHRAPTNYTDEPIQRTWVRSIVHHPE